MNARRTGRPATDTPRGRELRAELERLGRDIVASRTGAWSADAHPRAHPAYRRIDRAYRLRPIYRLVEGPLRLPPEMFLCVLTVAFREREIDVW